MAASGVCGFGSGRSAHPRALQEESEAAGIFHAAIWGVQTQLADSREVAELSEAITTQAPLFDSTCTTADRSNLSATHTLVQNYVINNNVSMARCFADGVLSAGDQNFPEQAASRLIENVRTKYICPKGGDGRSWNGVDWDGTELIYIGDGNIADPPQNLAGVVIHELMHTKGYGHPGPWGCPDCAEHPLTLTNHISECRSFPRTFPARIAC